MVPILIVIAFLIRVDSPAPDQSQDKDRGPAGGNLKGHWRDLADPDASKAYQAILALTQTPRETVLYIAGQLKPALAPDPRKVEQLIADLNSATFGVREKATQELTRMGGLAEAALKKALKDPPSLEASKRIEKLLHQLLGPLTLADQLQAVRAVETLEDIATAEAKALLASYAAGAPGASLTAHAKDVLHHWGRIDTRPLAASPSRTDLYGDPLPAGAVGRLGTIRFRKSTDGGFGPHGMAFLPNGKGLVTGDYHGVQVFDIPSGKLMHDFRYLTFAHGFALSPSGKEFAVSVDVPSPKDEPVQREIQVRAIPSGDVIRTFPHYTEGNEQFAFSPDSRLLFSFSVSMDNRDSTLRIEEIATGKELSKRRFPTADWSQGIAVSHDGKYLAINSGVNARKLFLWQWQTEEPRQLEGDYGGRGVSRLCFSPDGILLAGVQDFGSLYVWEVPSGRLLFQQDCAVDHYSFLGDIAFAPDGKTLAIAMRHDQGTNTGKTELLVPKSGKSQGFVETLTPARRLAFSPDSRLLAVADGNAIRLWDHSSRHELTSNLEAHRGTPSQIIVSATGLVATAGEENTVRLWDTATTKQLRLFVSEEWVRAISLSPNGKLLAASSLDDSVRVWDMGSGREIYRLAGHGRLGGRRTIGFLPDSDSLLSWGDDFYLRMWAMKNGKARFEHAIRPHGMVFSDEDQGRDRDKYLYSVQAITPDGKTFVLQIAGQVHLFETKTGKEIFKFANNPRFGSMAISPDSRLILLSNWSSYRTDKHPILLVDLYSGKTLLELTLPGYIGGPVAFSPDGRTIATSVLVDGQPNEILTFEIASGKMRSSIRGVPGRVWSLAFFPDGRRLASGLSDSSAVIWDLTARDHLEKR
jgi:WD40 repeat protein